jgi:predicted nucleotidyltransferase
VDAHLQFPTALHRRTAAIAADFFTSYPQVDTVLLVNSCARGQATPESDLDMAVLVGQGTSPNEVKRLEQVWLDFSASQPDVAQFKRMSCFTKVHLDVIAGEYVAPQWDDGGGPDSFEIEVGNQVAYSAPLSAPGPFFRQLQSIWLPYYEESLRLSRLTMVREGCLYDLDHVPHLSGAVCIFKRLIACTKRSRNFCRPSSLRAKPIRLLTTNGCESR